MAEGFPVDLGAGCCSHGPTWIVVSRLVECVSAYRQTDEAVQAGFAGVIQRETGDDPGMG